MLLMQRTVAVPINDVVGGGAIALAGYLRGAIRQQLDIAVEDDLNGGVDAAVALWQLRLGSVGDRCDSLTPGFAGRIVAVVGPGIAFPVIGCYNCHRSIPRREGLTVGV